MMKNSEEKQNEINPQKLKKLEIALRAVMRKSVSIDSMYKKNLDKLVENSIKAQKLEQKVNELERPKVVKKQGFWAMLTRGAKWNMALLSSFVGILLFGGIAFAAVPELREIIVPTKGEVNITTDPEGASVYVRGGKYKDFTLLGNTPYKETLEKGEYDLELVLEGYETFTTSFKLEAGGTFYHDYTLQKEEVAIDLIQEWKTHTNIEHGFKFTYPLIWEFREQVETDGETFEVSVVGEQSKISIYNGVQPFEASLGSVTIAEEEYRGVKDYNGWKYVLFAQRSSEDDTNTINIAFYTNDEEEIALYDFILGSIVVHPIQEQDEELEWTTYTNDETGFSIQHPQDWIVIAESVDAVKAQYVIKPMENTTDGLKIEYSLGYPEEFSHYSLVESDMQINGFSVDKYCIDQCAGKILYKFPFRFFVSYTVADDEDKNKIFEQIIGSLILQDKDNLQHITNYTFGYEITLPYSWEQTIVTDDTEYNAVSYSLLSNDFADVRIFDWSEFQDYWDALKEEYSIEGAEIQQEEIVVNGATYVQYSIWSREGEFYTLQASILGTGDVQAFTPVISFENREYVIIIEPKEIITTNSMTIPEGKQNEWNITSAIISNISPILD